MDFNLKPMNWPGQCGNIVQASRHSVAYCMSQTAQAGCKFRSGFEKSFFQFIALVLFPNVDSDMV